MTTVFLVTTLLAGCAGGETNNETDGPVVNTVTGTSEAAPTGAAEPSATVSSTGVEATSLPGPEAEAARAVVEQFDPDAEDAFLALNDLAFSGGEPNQANIVPALAPLLEDDDGARRWAALYVIALISNTPEEIAVLQTVLDDPEPLYRLHAAGSLAARGVVEALPVLIESLELEADMPYSEPPLTAADHARTTLEHYTGQTFPDAAGWRAWWEQVGGDLTWDGQSYAGG
ncbi:hypothetical protein BH23CHL2_BH23CHL2_23550 [soil metagenome]